MNGGRGEGGKRKKLGKLESRLGSDKTVQERETCLNGGVGGGNDATKVGELVFSVVVRAPYS